MNGNVHNSRRFYVCVALTYKLFIWSYPEKGRSAASFESPVFDFRLLCKILGALDRRIHPLDGEERGQVGSIRRNHDQSEKPPHTRHYARWHGSGKKNSSGAIGIFNNDSRLEMRIFRMNLKQPHFIFVQRSNFYSFKHTSSVYTCNFRKKYVTKILLSIP